jgi:HSP20 family protein
MAVMRWDPWGELALLQRDVNQLLGRTSGRRLEGALIPPMDVIRTAEGLMVRMELPGMDPSDVDISVNEGMLTVSGERKLDGDVAEDAWVVRERPVGRFERSFGLPKGTDAEAITASFDAGLLKLTIPAPPERRPHKVQISGGKTDAEALDVG